MELGDEPAHIDYALDLRLGHVPAWQDQLNQTTLRIVSCAEGQTPSSCRAGDRNPADAGAGGYSYEAQQPPLGYVPYALVATPSRSPQKALLNIRRGGMIWTAAAGVVLLAFALLEGLSLSALSVLLAVTLMCPQFFEWAATVTNDSAGAFAGGLALLAVTMSRRWGRPAALSLGIASGLVLGSLKGLYLAVPAALALQAFFATESWKKTPNRVFDYWRNNACVLGMLAGSVAANLGYVFIEEKRSTLSSGVVFRALLGGMSSNHVHLHTLLRSFVGLTTVFIPTFVPSGVSADLYYLWNLVLMGTVAGALVVRRGGEDARQSRALALGILGGAIGLATLWWILWAAQGYDASAPARYAIPLCPLIGLLVVKSTSTRVMWAIGLGLPFAAALSQFAVVGY